jgi:putative DNA primase/helicase
MNRRKRGIVHKIKKKGRNMQNMLDTIVHHANAEDEATGDAFEIFHFMKVGNRRGQIRVPRQDLQKPEALYTLLVRKNAALPLCPEKLDQKLSQIIGAKPRKRFLYSARVGWRPGGRGFVTPKGVIGCSKVKRRPLPPIWLGERHLIALREAGTWETWRDTVGKLSLRSNVAMLAICAAFAAPLLYFTRRQSFGINLFGPTKAGKTTTLLAGASVIGLGREADLPNWGATAAAKGESARIFNDMLFPLNEVGLLGGSKRKAYPEIRETIYRLGEGRERLRHTQSIFSAPAASSEVRTIFFSTAEHSFDDYATVAGETRDEGEYARCIDVPVNRPDRHSIINRFPAKLPKEKRRRWAEDRIIELRKACEANHGTAFRRYINYLIASRDRLEAGIEEFMREMDQFEQRSVVKGALEHARQNIGLLYAGGRLAIDAGVVPWKPEQLLQAVATCWRRALDLHGKKKDALTQAKRALRANLKPEKVKKRGPSASFSPEEADGYYVTKGGVRIYTVHAAAMRKWLGTDPKQFDRLLDWLDAERFLIPRQSATGMAGSDWAIQTPKWPNGKSVRSIVFRDPFQRGD